MLKLQQTRFHSVEVQFNKSLLSTDIVLKCMLYVNKKKQLNEGKNLKERFSWSLDLACYLTNQNQVIMSSWLPKVISKKMPSDGLSQWAFSNFASYAINSKNDHRICRPCKSRSLRNQGLGALVLCKKKHLHFTRGEILHTSQNCGQFLYHCWDVRVAELCVRPLAGSCGIQIK